MRSSIRWVVAFASVGSVSPGFAACSQGGGPSASTARDSGPPGDQASDAPLACPPSNLDEWHADTYHHAQAVQPSACDATLLDDYYASCLGPNANANGCDQNWGAGEDPAHATCKNCILTPMSSSVWGPLVEFAAGGDGGAGGTVSVNVAGCIEILDPSQLTCAMSAQLADECQHAACDSSCLVTGATSFADWQACIGAAAAGECNGALQSAACVNGEDAGPAAVCVTGKSFQDEFFAIARVFCGGTVTD